MSKACLKEDPILTAGQNRLFPDKITP